MKFHSSSIELGIAADDERLHLFAPFRMRHAEHGAFGNAMMRQQHFLDPRRHDVDSAGNDHIVVAAFEIEITAGIDAAEIARAPPAPVAVG